VDAEYRLENLHGVSRWMVDDHPDVVAGLLLESIFLHPA
jgi:hypothetical protein